LLVAYYNITESAIVFNAKVPSLDIYSNLSKSGYC